MPTKISGAPVLRWRNRNIKGTVDITTINIYKSSSPMDVEALPSPYDTINSDQNYYADQDVSYGQTYYYRVGISDGNEEKMIDGEVMFEVGDDSLIAPFQLDASFYNDDDSGDLQSPFDISTSYNKYLSE